MKLLQIIIKPGITALLLAGLSLPVCAQKLNNVQDGSVWAPANIKIDGKLNEWDDSFKAYNKTTDVFYTISNDEKNLYLVIKSANQVISNKIIGGGINFTVNTDVVSASGFTTETLPFSVVTMSPFASARASIKSQSVT